MKPSRRKGLTPRVVPKVREDLNADALLRIVQGQFAAIPEPRRGEVQISLADALLSAFAMFSLKDPSLLAFEERRACDPNLRAIFGIGQIPSDSRMREICDGVLPDQLRPAFRAVVHAMEAGDDLNAFSFLDGRYLVSLDGTGFFSSGKLSSPACLTKTNKKTGQKTFSLQLLGACLVHPDRREVLPLFPEMITNGDGQTKNDCERNAARRWLQKFRQDHPHLPVVITEDALSPNAPHIRDLQAHDCRFLLGVKPGDHRLLFDYIEAAGREKLVGHHEIPDPDDPRITHRFRFLDEVPLNKSNLGMLVHFVEYWEIGPKATQHFSWVTDLPVTADTVYSLMRGGRARWRIENETFNTLKNQGYHLGHNYGLGKKHLASVFACLMMLAFLVDQVQQHSCQLFQAVLEKLSSKRALWEKMRAFFEFLLFDSMTDLLWALFHGIERRRPHLLVDTS